MKKTTLILCSILAAGLFSSCDDDREHFAPIPSKTITVTTEIGQMTRVSDNADGSQKFDANDQISVYAWTGDATVAPAVGDRVVDNSINTYNGFSWKAGTQMLWKDQTTPHYFIGVYPHNATSLADLTAMPFAMDKTNPKLNDLLIATNTIGVVDAGQAVKLNFDHVFAMLTINFNFRTQFEGNPKVEKVVVKNALTHATVNCLTKTFTTTGDREDITLQPSSNKSQYSTIIIPQTGIRTIVITIDGKDYTFTHTDDINTANGKISTLNLNVGKDEITLGSLDINDWQKGTEINGGEAQ